MKLPMGVLAPAIGQVLGRLLFPTITQAGAGGQSLESAISALFANGEQGAWYDPSDMSTLFQDAAGTTPVTAVEQPVGKILDKSGRGNHASQTTAASRPVLSARKNKLLATTTLATQAVTLTASPHTLSFKGTGTVTLSGASTAGPLVGTGAGNRVSLTFTPSAGSVTFTVSGSVTEAQLEDGGAVGTYQRVTTATDYDTVGFPHYLKFDGVDDFLATGNIDFTSTDKMTMVAGVQKLGSGPQQGIIVEQSLNSESTPYGFALCANGWWQTNSAIFGANGGGGGDYVSGDTGTSYPTPGGYVCSLQSDLLQTTPSAHTKLRVNAANAALTYANTVFGTGNHANQPLYIGRRAGTSFPFNGELSSLVIRGAASTTEEIEAAEAFAANLHGVAL